MTPPSIDFAHAFEVCAQRTRQSGSSFVASFYILPAHKRRAMMALYAFCREVDDLVDDCDRTPSARAQAAHQLNQWSERLNRLAQNPPLATIASEPPIAQALYATAKDFALPYEDLHRVIEGMRLDLNFLPYADWQSLFHYCDCVAGAVGRLSARIFGFARENENAVLRYASALGRALQLINIIRDGKEDRLRTRLYFPQTLWHDSFSWEDFQRTQTLDEAQWIWFFNDGCLSLFFREIDQAFTEAFQALPPSEQAHQRAGLVMGRTYQQLYREIRRAYSDDPETTRLRLAHSDFRLTPWRKWMILIFALLGFYSS